MAVKIKMAGEIQVVAVLFAFVCVFQVEAHQDDFIENVYGETDVGNLQNGDGPRSMDYMGLPIDMPSRRLHPEEPILETTITTTTVATTPDYPPLNTRYRRVFNPDESASIKEYPFIAALLLNKKLWCGAAIITGDMVLTAAHCLQLQYNNRFFREYVKMLNVRVGSTNATDGGELMKVIEISFHPNYKPDTLEYNFAVLRLHKNLSMEEDHENSAKIIPYSRNLVLPTDSKIIFLGWGSVLASGVDAGQVLLQKLELPVYDLTDCQEIYGKSIVTRNNFCAGFISLPKNVCNHDAGGPAIMNGKLVGILSFSSKRCDVTDKPAVFSNVGVIAPWLDSLSLNPQSSVIKHANILK